eukprot:1057750-Amphidinium_carterae.1
MARVLCRASESAVKDTHLLIIGKILATMLLPGLVTVLCHAECLGVWVFFWHPCAHNSSSMFPLQSTLSLSIQFAVEGRKTFLSRSQVCGLLATGNWHGCTDALLDRSSMLLYGNLVHLAFTTPSVQFIARLVSGKHRRFTHESVLPSYTLIVVLMLGPCLPLLPPMSLVLALVQQRVVPILEPSSELVSDHDGDRLHPQICSWWRMAYLSVLLQYVCLTS